MQLTPELKAELRDKCKRDLYFLGKDILRKDFSFATHKPVCDFFVKKDPSFKTFKDFAESYGGSRDRLLLLPRGSYKSTVKMVDNIQWIINWPDIRIITLTAEKTLAKAFVEEQQDYFVVKGKAERNPDTNILEGGNPSLFQLLFLEHCISEDEARLSGRFISPARSKFAKDPTIAALSIEMSGSGWHCDIMDFDDVLSDDNTQTGMLLEKLEKRIAMATKLKMLYGFRHIVGTRYNPDDAYGKLANAHNIQTLYGEVELPQFSYMCKPCWWVKGTNYEQPPYKTWVPNAADVDLFFPEGLPFEPLAKELKEAPETFFSQELNDPQEAANLDFREPLIRGAIRDHTQVPTSGQTFIAWDLAYSGKNHRDYTVGAVGRIDDQGRVWIIDIIRGRYQPSETAFIIVDAIRRWKPKQISIEDSPGTRWMTGDLDRHAKQMNVPLNVHWISLGKGTHDQKTDRMSTLHPLLTSQRLLLLNTINCMDDLVKEFVSIGNKRQRNDIPDAISLLTTTYAHYSQMFSMPTTDVEAGHIFKQLAEEEFHNMIFGRGKYALHNDVPSDTEPEEPDYFIDSVTGLPSAYPF